VLGVKAYSKAEKHHPQIHNAHQHKIRTNRKPPDMQVSGEYVTTRPNGLLFTSKLEEQEKGKVPGHIGRYEIFDPESNINSYNESF
jgi:hypothetical protein